MSHKINDFCGTFCKLITEIFIYQQTKKIRFLKMFFAYIYDNEVKNRKKNFAKKCYFLAIFGKKKIEKKI